MGVYITGFIAYGVTLAFYVAVFPRFALNTRLSRGLREKYERGEIPVDEYEEEASLEKSRISSISWVCTFPCCPCVRDDTICRHLVLSASP